ncbi:MAG: AAA family ATPase [Planctomycetes bacterium]|nr:AAA family ATPase [Planctomycetota bacterium]
MARLQIKREVLESTRERSILSAAERTAVDKVLRTDGKGPEGKGQCHVNVGELPVAFLRSLLDDHRLTANQRAAVIMHVHGMSAADVDRDKIYDTPVGTPVEFGSSFALLGMQAPNCEMFLNGRWYPVVMHINFFQDYDKKTRVALHGAITMCERHFDMHHAVSRVLFLDDNGERRSRSVRDILNHFGLRAIQTRPGDFNLKLVRAERLAREVGKQALIFGSVVVAEKLFWWTGFETRALGTPDLPRKGVIEPELEVVENERNYYTPSGQVSENSSRLPFVRVFSMDFKSYVYVDVEDMAAYEYEQEAMSKLHLPADMMHILTRVFTTPVEKLFGDLIRGKHGGVVVLACGSPGVGKTLTAEVYAEQTERPLYVLELGELGTNVALVEENLRRVFTRVARWNAVLQFDECEIFLAHRNNDLERSAIVGCFLRLLDYYQGILFLTTNRPDALDHAVMSRVMLKLIYPDLDQRARAVIWRTMFVAAGLKLTEDEFDELAAAKVNGRQIRNLTRLAKILHPEGCLGLDQMRQVLALGS